MGHVGLPTACILAHSGYCVLGVDTNDETVSKIKAANLTTTEPNLQALLIKVLQDQSFQVSTDVTPADVYIIAVPTPLAHNNTPDTSMVNTAINFLKPHLQPGNLILIESTCPIGTTEKLAQRLLNICPRIHVAYCPERILPGNILYELIHNDRVVGGIDEASTQCAADFYRSFVKGEISTTDARTAEAVKLVENTYRDLNIAYANELSMIASYINLDINEVIRLANKHPRVQILEPGPGVGGHCIAVDPWFLASASLSLAGLTLKAREVNIKKTLWVIEKVSKTIKKNKAKVVACLGLTYKPNVSDIRESPALTVVQALEKKAKVLRVDPYVSNTHDLYDALACADIVVGLVAHTIFLNISPSYLTNKIVLDFAGIFK